MATKHFSSVKIFSQAANVAPSLATANLNAAALQAKTKVSMPRQPDVETKQVPGLAELNKTIEDDATRYKRLNKLSAKPPAILSLQKKTR